jgi:methionyl-tRNA formyltransferase
MRIVFAGTPEPALPSLQRLIDSRHHEVVAVLTRPDAAAGRRGKPAPSPVARLALDAGIPLLRPARPNAAEFVAELSALAPDCCAVVAYGALLGKDLLAVPRRSRRRSPPATPSPAQRLSSSNPPWTPGRCMAW